MGHYDSAYAHDAENARKLRVQHAQHIKNNLDALKGSIGSVKVPPRFLESLSDFDNWLKVTYKVE